MAGALQRRPVQALLVAIRLSDQGARIVRYDHLRHTTEIAECLAQRDQLVHLGFARRRAGIGVIRGTQGRDEHMRPADFPQ